MFSVLLSRSERSSERKGRQLPSAVTRTTRFEGDIPTLAPPEDSTAPRMKRQPSATSPSALRVDRRIRRLRRVYRFRSLVLSGNSVHFCARRSELVSRVFVVLDNG
jgi:hypothetical protein